MLHAQGLRRGTLEWSQLEFVVHLEGVKSCRIPHAVLGKPPLDELHGVTARIHRSIAIQCRKYLSQAVQPCKVSCKRCLACDMRLFHLHPPSS